MAEPLRNKPSPENGAEDRLDSWKEIAAYLKRDVTTVQRWEKREGMPVHRHLHDRLGSVYASKTELTEWANSRNPPADAGAGKDFSALGLPTDGRQEAAAPTIKSGHRGRSVAIALALLAGCSIALILWLQETEYFWRSPIADARFQAITDFEGLEQAAAISRDGHFVAFLSNRAGQMDVWLTQVGSGQFHNLTQGKVGELLNPSIRTLGFSPDGAMVTFWARRAEGATGKNISVWSVPTLSGEPRPYLEGAAELDWSYDGAKLAYHTPGPGDPLFVTESNRSSQGLPIFTASAGLHSHYPVWSPDSSFIYFVQGTLPDKLDIWRIASGGGTPERITQHAGRVSHPVFLDRRTLMYLASDPDGSGPRLRSVDVERRISHPLSSGLDRYTSLAASLDGRRLVVTVASPKPTLWRLKLSESGAVSTTSVVPLGTSTGFSPRLGPNYLVYVSANFAANATGESIWKQSDGINVELWTGGDAHVIGAPSISRDGNYITFSVRHKAYTFLYVMRANGTDAHTITDSLDLQGSPAWAPDGRSITSAAMDHGIPRLFRVPLDGSPPIAMTQDYSLDPTWAPDGSFVVYSGADIGTTFPVKAVTAQATPQALPSMTLTRGARHLAFLPGKKAILLLRGQIQHKDLWLVDLDTGKERRLTNFGPDFDLRDFDLSPDGQEVILERVQERSDVALVDLIKP